MVEKRSDLENVDRVDPADYTVDFEDRAAEGEHRTLGTDGEGLERRENASMATPAEDGENDSPAEAEHIKGQIEATRNQMGETIDAIQDKLSFSNLSEQVSEHVNNAVETAKDAVYDATIGKAASMMKNISGDISNSSIIRSAKNNPLPFVLIGLGTGLLAYQTYAGNNKKSKRYNFRADRDSSYDPQDMSTERRGSMRASTTETISGSAGKAYDKVSDAAGTAYDKVTGIAETAYTGVSDVANQAYSKVGELKTTAVEQYDHYIEENPLAVGAVALALGAAVGMAIPATRYESRLMGEARQTVLDKAQDTAAGLLDKTKQVVTEAGKNITDQARASMSDH